MAIRVLKYGGKSLANTKHILAIAQQISEWKKQGDQILVVVSAMGTATNDLIQLASEISKHPQRRELDMLVSTGERVSMSLMSMALNDLGCEAISFTGSQAGILTDDKHAGANIIDVKAFRVKEELDKGKIVVLAGFQGVCPETKEITTLGRGGTDTSAVALANFLKADSCEMYKDVDGVFNADPKLVNRAKKIQELSYDQLLWMCQAGAKIIHPKAVELAKNHKVKLMVKKAHDDAVTGTVISDQAAPFSKAISLNHSPSIYEFRLLKEPSIDKGDIKKTILSLLEKWNFSDLVLIDVFQKNEQSFFFLRGTDSNLDFFVKALEDEPVFELIHSDLSEISLSYNSKDQIAVLTFPEIYYQCPIHNNLHIIVKNNHLEQLANKIFNEQVS